MLEAVRLLALCGAGALLLYSWRWIWRAADDWRLRLVVTTGFLIRLIAGQLLFWISFAEVPVARSLQAGNGLWFFAQDATLYTSLAHDAASGGLAGILDVPRSAPSASYVQMLAVFSYLFGHPIAVSLLLNLLCFMGTCAIILRWSARTPAVSRNAALVALSVISFAPGGLLWSLQPLKDTFFQFAMVAFAGAAFLWQSAWRGEGRPRLAAAAGAAMTVTLFLISGVRWYLGLILLAVSAMFLLVVALQARVRRVVAITTSVVVLLVLSRAVLFAAEPYLNPALLATLQGRPKELATAPQQIKERLDASRSGFEASGGNTLIRPGRRMTAPAEPPRAARIARNSDVETRRERNEPQPAVPEITRVRDSSFLPAGNAGTTTTGAALRDGGPALVAAATDTAGHAANPPQMSASTSTVAPPAADRSGAVAPARATLHSASAAEREHPAPSGVLPPPAHEAGRTVASEKRSPQAQRQPAPKPHPPAPLPMPPPAAMEEVQTIAPLAVRPAPVPAVPEARSPNPTAAAVPSAVQIDSAAHDVVQRPQSRMAKLATGAAAVTLPPSMAIGMGLVEVRSQSKLWWYVELDTIFFDALLLFVAGTLIYNFRNGAYRNGMFWLLLGAAALVGLALAYTVTNFGTLFRLRMMFSTLAALIPLTLMTSSGCDAERPPQLARAPAQGTEA